jgi:myo-inositol-1(or 4)-monophosphatase
MHPILNIAVKAARRAGNIINRATRNLDIVSFKEKAANDFVSEVDREAEQAIIRTLHEAYPDHSILAEESGASGRVSDYQWIIDPLDGTTNFLHGFPQYSVAIALLHKGVITQAVVFDPGRNDLFTATRGRGAHLNDQRMRVSRRAQLKSGLIGTGLPFRQHDHLDAYLRMLRDVMVKSGGVRRAGSAALDLAYVAAGRLDGFWELGLSPWDIAAGSLLITESGGLIGDLEGNQTHMEIGHVVAGNPRVFGELLQVIGPHLTPALKQRPEAADHSA